MAVLITGGAGYIGAHVADLVRKLDKVIVVDDLSSGLIGRTEASELVVLDLAGSNAASVLEDVLRSRAIDTVLHLAGRKSLDPAITDRANRFEFDNVRATENVLHAMANAHVGRIVFASSAAVYGSQDVPVVEDARPEPISEYGFSKLRAEHLLHSAYRAHGITTVVLRLFNVVGASAIGRLDRGEDGLMPALFRTALGQQPFRIFGTDHPTRDGTCVRDFVDVRDVARAFVAAGAHTSVAGKYEVLNIGSGHGTSLSEALALFRAASGKDIDVEPDVARPGDIATSVASVVAANVVLGWAPARSFAQSVESLLRLAEIT